MAAEGWELFKEAVKDAGAGDLPQLLRSIHTMTTPPPAPMDLIATMLLLSPIKKEAGTPGEDLILMRVGEGTIYLPPV